MCSEFFLTAKCLLPIVTNLCHTRLSSVVLPKSAVTVTCRSSTTSDISKAREEFPDLRVLRDRKGRLVKKVTVGLEVIREQRDLRDLPVQLDHPALQGPPVTESMSDGIDFKDRMKRAQAP